MSIPVFGGPAEPGAGQQTTGRPQRGVLHSVQAGRMVPSPVTGCVRVTHPGGVALAMLATCRSGVAIVAGSRRRC